MSCLNKDFERCFFQDSSILVRESSISSPHKVVVKTGVGVLWRTNGHIGKVQVFDWVGGDRGGNGILLPIVVRLANQDSSTEETKTDNTKP